MKIVADINISLAVVGGLKAMGHDIERSDASLAPTATDIEIAAAAARIGALVLTRDQDFSAIVAMSSAKAPSLINLRHSSTDSNFLIRIVGDVLHRHRSELELGAIITIDDGGIRVHKLPIGSDG